MCRAVGGTHALLKDTLLCWPPAERTDRQMDFPRSFELKKLHLGGDLECQVPLSPVLAPDNSHLVLPRMGGFLSFRWASPTHSSNKLVLSARPLLAIGCFPLRPLQRC